MIISKTEINILDSTVIIYGVTHNTISSSELVNRLNNYNFDIILYEEHVTDGYNPNKVTEHKAIEKYRLSENCIVQSMDIPSNTETVKSLIDVYPCRPPTIKEENLLSEKGIQTYLDRFSAKKPFLYIVCMLLRNYCMAMKILWETGQNNKLCAVTGVTHVHGENGLIQLINCLVEN